MRIDVWALAILPLLLAAQDTASPPSQLTAKQKSELAAENKRVEAAIPRVAACGFKNVHVGGGKIVEKPGYTEIYGHYIAVDDGPTPDQLACAARVQVNEFDLEVGAVHIGFAPAFKDDYIAALDREREEAARRRAPPAQRAQVEADVRKIAECGFTDVKVLYDVWPTIQITTASASEAQRICVAKIAMESPNGIVFHGPLQSAFKDVEYAMEREQAVRDLKTCGFRKVHKRTVPGLREGQTDEVFGVDDSKATRKQLACAVDAPGSGIDFTSAALSDAYSKMVLARAIEADRENALSWLRYYGYSAPVPLHRPGKRWSKPRIL